jgi:hypothetical protein
MLSDRMAALLAPDLGEHTADVVARHICAKFGVDESGDAATLELVGDFLRRGLVAYVGAERAQELAERCVAAAAPPPA